MSAFVGGRPPPRERAGTPPREKLGISDYAGGPDPVHGLDAPHPGWDKDIFRKRPALPPRDRPPLPTDDDWAKEQARHQRRMQLMRMQGDCNRQERRMYIWWTIAAVLGALALIGSML